MAGPAWSAGVPTAAAVPPGSCYFGDEFKACAVKSRVWVSADTVVVTFALDSPEAEFNLPTCACVLARGGADDKGEAFVRPYTPISTNAMKGQFELMVKVYPEGNLSKHLSTVAVGATVDFKHIVFNVKLQYPFHKKRVGMIVGGTGISPMIQALHSVLGTPSDPTRVSMLYGSRTSDGILAKEVLDEWCAAHADRLEVTHVLSNEPADSKWAGDKGFISAKLISEHFAPPSDGGDVLIFVCGPPPMYNAFCGPRTDKEVTGILADLGYSADQVCKF
ncbi:hypothetical protein M885DRAFT_508563 [Pelagophyceae sp. CCMP2097]|nr:hypothetical protein M885DRAFT_508563 [Pelagophyceae sp. CCMP2097]|mmetsp:Transcript_18539/g.62553  ORF Transcript_18539/g.62553 Transcript_18539/m.62553 type:complete len:277 (+) Transcript_18539:62-892(+)